MNNHDAPAAPDKPTSRRQSPYLQEAVALMAGIVLPGGFFGYAAYRVVKYKRWRLARQRRLQTSRDDTPQT